MKQIPIQLEQCTVNHLLPYLSEEEASSTYNQFYLQTKFCSPKNLTVEMVEVLNINAQPFKQLGVVIQPCYLFNATGCLGKAAFDTKLARFKEYTLMEYRILHNDDELQPKKRTL